MLIARHKGQWKMVELVTRNFWWLKVTKEVKQYVEGCDQYQRMKNKAEIPVRKLRPNEIPVKDKSSGLNLFSFSFLFLFFIFIYFPFFYF